MSRTWKRKSLVVMIVMVFCSIYFTKRNFTRLFSNRNSDIRMTDSLHYPKINKKNSSPAINTTHTKKLPVSINKPEKRKTSSFQKLLKNNTTEEQKCQANTNIAFFKMHKCSSSTVQNILFRYGEERNLNFVLPIKGNYLSLGIFNKHHMMPFPIEKYNIICHHTRFSYTGFQEVLPVETKFVTIIRDPVTMFESMFTYCRYDVLYDISEYDDPLGQFLENPESYYNSHSAKNHAKNPMLYDLGLSDNQKTNRTKIETMILELSKQFDLIMITEYFDESLILLKELMCWDFKDVIYVVLNARAEQSVRDISPENAIKIRNWNEGDVKLYNHFNATFWRKVQEFGTDRMEREIIKLREHIKHVQSVCIESVTDSDQKVWHPGGIKVMSFRLKASAIRDPLCLRLVRTELPYTDLLRRKQAINVQKVQKLP